MESKVIQLTLSFCAFLLSFARCRWVVTHFRYYNDRPPVVGPGSIESMEECGLVDETFLAASCDGGDNLFSVL